MCKPSYFLIFNLLIFNLLIFNLFADPIDSAIAKKIATNFITQESQILNLKSQVSINLAYVAYDSSKSQISNLISQHPLYYVYNINPDGFVIIAADNDVIPVLAYSLHGKYSNENEPPAFTYWMKNYENQVLFVKKNKLKADINIQSLWKEYSQPGNNQLSTNNKQQTTKRGKGGVPPMLSTAWNQGCYYNNFCPSDNAGPCNHDYAGCTATAMAQIMKFWNYPQKGRGLHTDLYSAKTGPLSVDFSHLNFKWDSMPNNLSYSSSLSQINAIDSLLYACGVSIDMNYAAGGSGAWLQSVPFALENYFNYSTSATFIYEYYFLSQHSFQDWIALLKNELDNGRPVQYQGYDQSEGHAFVCDGYDNAEYFHFNWGWSGQYDGYFLLNLLNPGSLDFCSFQGAIIGIQPANDPGIKLELYSKIDLTPDTIYNTKPFSVNVSILNPDTVNFTGRLAAFLFDIDNKKFTIDSTLNIQQISKLDSQQFTFSSNGIDSAVPGHYKLGILYRTMTGEWVLADNGNYENLIDVLVTGPLYKLKLYSDINISPSPILQYDSVKITCLVNNYGNGIFKGKLGCGLLDVSQSWLGYLDSIDNIIIPPDTTVSFTFKTLLSEQPGNYYVAAWYQQWDSVEVYFPWGKYSNPKSINIRYKPDIYEPNNSESCAYNFSFIFKGDSFKILTTGSNFNTCQDTDFYKIILSPGYDYSVSAYVEDKGNDIFYNTLADFAYKIVYIPPWSVDSGLWPIKYIDTDTVRFNVSNGGEAYFRATPHNPCIPGTYLLNISVKRYPNVGISNLKSQISNLILFPNPASDILNIRLPASGFRLPASIRIYNSLGKLISKFSILNSQFSIQTSSLTNGIYFLEAIVNDKIYFKKFVISS